MAIGIVLAIGKAFVYQETGSVGILSSLVHSSLDLIGAVSTFAAVRYAAQPPDGTYRFGRGKAESFSAVFQVCLIVFAASHLLEEAWERMIDPQPIMQSGFAIAAMLVFIAITVWLLIAQSWAVRATGSVAIRGDRAHYLADLMGNVVVIIGLVMTRYTPFERADAIVGILMALWLLYTAYRVARIAWAQLLDRELPSSEREMIKALALQDPRVRSVNDLRTRASGPHIHIQMRLDLDETLSLSDAHDIVISAEKRMMSAYQAADILIHPHPVGCHATHGNVRFRSDHKHDNAAP
jgi:cation diffusion facilitator family transporter